MQRIPVGSIEYIRSNPDIVDGYNGYVSLFLYHSMHEPVVEALKIGWNAINDICGKNWLNLLSEQKLSAEHLGWDNPDFDHFMVGFPSTAYSRDTAVSMARLLGIKASTLPCLVFFDSIADKPTFVIRLERWRRSPQDIADWFCMISDCQSQCIDELTRHYHNGIGELGNHRSYLNQCLKNCAKTKTSLESIRRSSSIGNILGIVQTLQGLG